LLDNTKITGDYGPKRRSPFRFEETGLQPPVIELNRRRRIGSIELIDIFDINDA